MDHGGAGRAMALPFSMLAGALGCRAPSRSVATDLPHRTDAEPERFADAQLGGPPPDLAAGAEHPLDSLVMRIVAAAEAEDFESLAALMPENFVTMDEVGRDEIVAMLRQDPKRHLGNLVALLRGECAFVGSVEAWICPLALVEKATGDYGNALRTHFASVNGAWRWVAYVPDETLELAASSVFLRPSESPVIAPPELPPGTPGAPDSDPVRRVVRSHIHEVRACYNEGLARDPALRGRVAMHFTIGTNGDVLEAVVLETSLPDRRVAACITKAVMAWRFPAPEGGQKVLITYPFVLEPG